MSIHWSSDCRSDPCRPASEGLSQTHKFWSPHGGGGLLVMSKKVSHVDVVGTKGWKVCLESTAALVDSNVGEQGGVAWREDGRYGKVGGIDGGGAGGN